MTIYLEATDRICGNRLKAVMATFVEAMEQHEHLSLEQEVRNVYSE